MQNRCAVTLAHVTHASIFYYGMLSRTYLPPKIPKGLARIERRQPKRIHKKYHTKHLFSGLTICGHLCDSQCFNGPLHFTPFSCICSPVNCIPHWQHSGKMKYELLSRPSRSVWHFAERKMQKSSTFCVRIRVIQDLFISHSYSPAKPCMCQCTYHIRLPLGTFLVIVASPHYFCGLLFRFLSLYILCLCFRRSAIKYLQSS